MGKVIKMKDRKNECSSCSQSSQSNLVDRRTFIQRSAKGVAGLVITGAGIPLLLSACATGKASEKSAAVDTSSMIDLGEVEQIKQGPFPLKIDYNTKIKDGWADIPLNGFVYITQDTNGELLVMSPICTHLGCTVPYADEENKKQGITYLCPCHGGKYDEQGINVGGPPPRPLDIFKPVIQDGRMYIQALKPIKREAKT